MAHNITSRSAQAVTRLPSSIMLQNPQLQPQFAWWTSTHAVFTYSFDLGRRKETGKWEMDREPFTLSPL
jgi:hypothetical protein